MVAWSCCWWAIFEKAMERGRAVSGEVAISMLSCSIRSVVMGQGLSGWYDRSTTKVELRLFASLEIIVPRRERSEMASKRTKVTSRSNKSCDTSSIGMLATPGEETGRLLSSPCLLLARSRRRWKKLLCWLRFGATAQCRARFGDKYLHREGVTCIQGWCGWSCCCTSCCCYVTVVV